MRGLLKGFVWFLLLLLLLGGALLGGVYYLYNPQLPNPDQLREVKYQLPLEIYSHDGQLIAQFGDKKRTPLDIKQIPKPMIDAVLAAEDARFYQHNGVDIQGILRAAIELIRSGQKRQGGSTITMQVARNFFLSPEKTYERKIKEILLALKIERHLSKDEILELYLNKIYLGHHAYGVAAAANVYYGKDLAELNLAQYAMIAGLPKAPSRYNPITNPSRALERRNYILKHMLEHGMIEVREYNQAIAQPVTANLHKPKETLLASHLAEMVRQDLFERYGEAIYSEGYRVFTTLNLQLQKAADLAVKKGLHQYDERHGYRGPEGKLPLNTPIEQVTQSLAKMGTKGLTTPGWVTSINPRANSANVLLEQDKTITLTWENIRWARPALANNHLGKPPTSVTQVLKPGDLIRVRFTKDGQWRLTQIPKVEGALVSVDSRTGAIIALVGGYDFALSKFNRVTDAQRQPGSGFKPVLYTAALESGFTAASLFNDAPIVYTDSEGDWRPQNYSGRFYGPTRLRVALRNSRNLVSIRLLQEVGLDKVIEVARRFGFKPEQLPKSPTLALGSGTATPLDMARMFSVFANGGYRINPYYIERIETADGTVIEQSQPKRACNQCLDSAPRILAPRIHYIMHSLLQDVVRRGTAVKAKVLKRSDLAGKTGTTNDQRDAWFNGYASPLVAVSWVGFDSAKPLGNGETGGKAALPIWIEYMKTALKDQPENAFPMPKGIVTVPINPETGLRVTSNAHAIHEIFREEFAPEEETANFQNDSQQPQDSVLNSLF
ncbi:MAG: peptidase [Methylothermaceae bacteria B42]|nr:MAG: peptidase [Methylothermaceae bacteria B42]HHJ38163.1 penicillin-binding protein 1A [Methylothermaceae bacterium]